MGLDDPDNVHTYVMNANGGTEGDSGIGFYKNIMQRKVGKLLKSNHGFFSLGQARFELLVLQRSDRGFLRDDLLTGTG